MSNFSSIYLVIDTETTGLHIAKHGLIQVAALALDKDLNIRDKFMMDIKPNNGYEVSEEALEVNGFTRERISKGFSYTHFCSKFMSFVEKNFSETPTTIGQFYPFDFAVLDYVFTISGYPDNQINKIISNKFIDTKSLVMTLNMIAQKNNKEKVFPVASLSKPGGLKDKLGIDSSKFVAHDAMGDVLATREVLLKLIEYLPDLVSKVY